MRNNRVTFGSEHVKCLMLQLLTAIQYLHDSSVFHRELNTSKIQLTEDGILKADFGQQDTPDMVGYSTLLMVENIVFDNYPPGGLDKKMSRELRSNDQNIYKFENTFRLNLTGSQRITNDQAETPDTEVARTPFHLVLQNSRLIGEFEVINRVNEETYGVVYRASDNQTGDIVALKHFKKIYETTGFSIAAQRELDLLMEMEHINIVTGHEIAVGSRRDQ
ncbi:uncharacterized protein LOC126911174 [Spodoptera frugiperda]|uniref:Uncharacterized protein LOC126911174 n=1 Tax=Spodoptera frugiperda TaxID=7108 RepID=A0A9R0DSQ6_SPOFR|nr:uncharacterized protein LOC126911174 [Spodoptera frugiperda]